MHMVDIFVQHLRLDIHMWLEFKNHMSMIHMLTDILFLYLICLLRHFEKPHVNDSYYQHIDDSYG